jgi:release factor glutamine methyltransferase
MTTAREVAGILSQAGIASADHDARVLTRYAADHSVALDRLVAARASRVPLQHLTGTAGFRYLDIAVGPGVFVPRPETELLVDAVLAAIEDVPWPVVVDLCAGSGAIGLSVAQEHPRAVVHLVERSELAFGWLSRNAAGRDRVKLHHADLAAAPIGLDGAVDVVVANPPYVPLDERELVDPEVRDHDPGEALWAGEDGLEVIRRIVGRAATLLRPGGTLVVEHSDRHGASAPALLTAAGFIEVVDHLDLTGRPRFCVGVWATA